MEYLLFVHTYLTRPDQLVFLIMQWGAIQLQKSWQLVVRTASPEIFSSLPSNKLMILRPTITNASQENVQIKENAPNDITNLDGLSGITSIDGNLDIIDNQALSDLSGLGQLESIGGFLRFFNDDALPNLNGLGSLGFYWKLSPHLSLWKSG